MKACLSSPGVRWKLILSPSVFLLQKASQSDTSIFDRLPCAVCPLKCRSGKNEDLGVGASSVCYVFPCRKHGIRCDSVHRALQEGLFKERLCQPLWVGRWKKGNIPSLGPAPPPGTVVALFPQIILVNNSRTLRPRVSEASLSRLLIRKMQLKREGSPRP